jgi:diguanylate cyclase (GGDEF)-like protein
MTNWSGAEPREPGTTIDQLTGLLKRRAFLHQVEAALDAGLEGSLGYADIDRFKLINDRLGHAEGDRLLVQVAERLVVGSIPQRAVAARYGGDEFGIFLPGCKLDEALVFFEAWLRAVRLPMHFVGDGSRASRLVEATMSIGVTYADERGVELALRESDMALYKAKRLGGNMVVAFDERVREFLWRTNGQARDVERLARENEKLYDEARTDSLTGLRNARALAEIEQMSLGQGNCPWTTAAVVFVDIDCFGKYNHSYGDAAGDAVLRKVANALRLAARNSDLVFRKGGEEFVIVLPEVGSQVVAAAGERIRTAIELLAIPHRESEVADVVTATVAACWGNTGESLAVLRAIAGDLVMAAKQSGDRNQVHLQEMHRR